MYATAPTRPAPLRALAALTLLGSIGAQPGCGPLEAELDGPGVIEAPIVDGMRETGEPAVVVLMGVTGLCTGTLISPRVVLTAKHCVVPERASGPIGANLVTVGIGDRAFGATRSLRVREIVTTPGPLRISGGGNPVSTATGTDIALLVLRERVEDITPIPVRRVSADGLAGADAVAIGFGNTRAGTSGLKNRQDTTISGLTPVLIEAIETICQGDSGGPLLVERDGVREVAGVASFGVYAALGMVGACPSDADYWNRVDVQLELIDLALLRAGECPPSEVPRVEACNSLDDDCDGEVDEGCAAIGALCEQDADCAFGPMPEGAAATSDPAPVRCIDLGDGERRCSIPCDASTPAGCRALARPLGEGVLALTGLYCRSLSGCEGACAPGVPGDAQNAEACTTDTDCVSLRCAAIGDTRLCITPCLADQGSCPVGDVCSAVTGTTGPTACGFCADAASLPTGRALGEVCEDGAQCASSMCMAVGPEGSARVCTQACTNDGGCPAAFHCRGGACASGPRGNLLTPCRDAEDCTRSASCVGEPGATYCTITCDNDLDCGDGGVCDLTSTPSRCAPRLAPAGTACTEGASCHSGACIDGACTVPCSPRVPCAPGLECHRLAEGPFCIAPTPEAPPVIEMGGCSCRAGARATDRSALLLGTLLGTVGFAVLGRRRRRSRGAVS